MAEATNVTLVGEHGVMLLLDLFDGCEQLVPDKHMVHAGKLFEKQYERLRTQPVGLTKGLLVPLGGRIQLRHRRRGPREGVALLR